MKNIKWSRQFSRHYKQRIARDEQLRNKFWESIETFVIDFSLVDDHALESVMSGLRAFSIDDEYRVIDIEREDCYLFLDVGTHEQVYRR